MPWLMSCLTCGRHSEPKISPPVHLLLKPPDADLLGHVFKEKYFKKSRPCNLCHQPIKHVASSCRVCKYACHKMCEPKNLSGKGRRSFEDPARQIFEDRHRRHGNVPAGGAAQRCHQPAASVQPITHYGTIGRSPGTGSLRMGDASGRNAQPQRRLLSRAQSSPAGTSPCVMDLSFVTERILSLSFPTDIGVHLYRDGLRQAAAMLQTKHGDNYMVFNLSPAVKELAKWNPRVLDVGWQDQLAPPLERLCSVCRALDSWLQADPQHVAVLHSKCGVQRVGVVVASYSEYIGLCAGSSPQEQSATSLDRFAMRRYLNERIGLMQSPSDKRYVDYFAGLLSGAIQVNSSPLFLDQVTVIGVPSFEPNGGCRAFFKVYQGTVPVYTSSIYRIDSQQNRPQGWSMPVGERGLQLRGDILIKCYHRYSKPLERRETVFSIQFHTCAITSHTLVFQRQDLDDACRDLRFPLDGSVRLHFSAGYGCGDPSRSTALVPLVESSAGDPVVRWDSYETLSSSNNSTTTASTTDDEDERTSHLPVPHHHSGRLSHTLGPLDGSLYAKVVKNEPKSSQVCAQPATGTPSSSSHSPLRYIDPSTVVQPQGTGGSQRRHLYGADLVRFVNSPHVASTDSGISSAGVIPRTGLNPRSGDLVFGGGSSASPPHSAESAATHYTDPLLTPTTPSPIRLSDPSAGSIVDTSAASSGSCPMPSLVETRAEIHRPQGGQGDVMSVTSSSGPAPAGGPQLAATTSELDQLLTGMLMNVQNIPDIRASQTRHLQRVDDIDVDSIQVNFDLSGLTVRPAAPAPPPPPSGEPVAPPRKNSLKHSFNNNNNNNSYIFESDTVQRKVQPSTGASPAPPKPQPAAMGKQQHAKEIPYHAREDSKPFTYGIPASANGDMPTSPSIHRRNWKQAASQQTASNGLESPSLVRKLSGSDAPPGVVGGNPRCAPRVPVPALAEGTTPTTSAASATSPRPLRKLSALYGTSPPANNVPLPVATSSPRLESRSASSERHSPAVHANLSLEETIQDISTSSDSSRLMGMSDLAGLTWLQRQQQKLRERKDSLRRQERQPQEVRLISELRAAQHSKSQHQRPGDDGYLSDVTLFSEHTTSREGSPDALPTTSTYATPLHINTSASYGQSYQSKSSASGHDKTLSTPNSPLLTHRSSSLERTGLYSSSMQQQQQQQQAKTLLSRQKSDLSHDRERPFMAVKRAHEQQRQKLINGQTEDSVISWGSSVGSEDLSNRPVTPAFPVTVPRTPYLNVHGHHGHQHEAPTTPNSVSSGSTGLPPKSPTTPRKERSPSPSASSAYLGLNGSRRSSTSAELHDVNPVHVNFVKDTSRFWYKPNIAREDAINLLKEKTPGTFIVRDSNSFPGAFGLALKVATPPPHAASKNNGSSDPAAELVRHFLIEPTSKGVRIKGCNNEPVFGSLSALIYQHSVTPLALPAKLLLPEADVVTGTVDTVDSGLGNPVSQLLSQGAACNVLYLFTMDTESLTGPQAIQRSMTHMLDSKPLPTPTVVHFKVSAQGITLTDSERKLFFRRHYPVATISFCGLDPEDRRWNQRSEETGLPISSNRCFGFVARKAASKTDNQCHIFAELEPEQPATAIVNFVAKVMMSLPGGVAFKSTV